MTDEKTIHDRRGYLNEEFLLFHLKDSKGEKYEYHYHDFYKIIIFISGRVTYLVEGNAYELQPWDILLITNRDLHKAIIETDVPYERVVIWLNPRFLEKSSSPGSNLLACFDSPSLEPQKLLRLVPDELQLFKARLQELEKAFESNRYGSIVERNSLFLLLAVHLNRVSSRSPRPSEIGIPGYDKAIGSLIKYINENVAGDLSIEFLSRKYFLSRFTLMHKFKNQTGFTLHSYILQKRLLAAGTLIRNGRPVMETGFECGFADYSSFVRAFRRFYGVSPREYAKNKPVF